MFTQHTVRQRFLKMLVSGDIFFFFLETFFVVTIGVMLLESDGGG